MGELGFGEKGRWSCIQEQGYVPVECRQGLTASLRRKGYCNIISSVVLKIENK